MYKVINKNESENYTYFKVEESAKFFFIKKLNHDSDELKAMMQQEIDVYIQLKSLSFIPKIISYNLEEDCCIMYEYIDGKELDTYKNMTLKQVIKLFLIITQEVEKIHSFGIVHCDLKPNNILIDSSGKVYIIDFANAKKNGEKISYGSKRYCSIEQLYRNKVSPYFDIYALGVVMYELLTGSYAFKNLQNQELLRAKKKNPLIVFGVPNLVNEILLKATSFEKEKRYKTISEMREDLKLLLEQCK